MKRQGIFLLYDEQGCVDEYIVYMLQSMNQYFDRLQWSAMGYFHQKDGKN